MSFEWRACVKDTGDGTCDTAGPFPTRIDAEHALLRLIDAEPPYDERWLEWRHVPTWFRVEIAEGWVAACMRTKQRTAETGESTP